MFRLPRALASRCSPSPSPALARSGPAPTLSWRPLLPVARSLPAPRFYCAAADAGKPSLLQLVVALRKDTGAGVSESKEALEHSGMDIEKAKVYLANQAVTMAKKKSGRAAVEGGVAVSVVGARGVLAEVNCETDFASKEDAFAGVALDISKAIAASDYHGAGDVPIEDILALPHSTKEVSGKAVSTVGDAVEQLLGTLRENVKIRRVTMVPEAPLDDPSAYRVFYRTHGGVNATNPDVGRIGGVICIKVEEGEKPLTEKQELRLKTFGEELALQVVAMKPLYLTEAEMTAATAKEGAEAVEDDEDADDDYEPVFLKQDSLVHGKPMSTIINRFNKQFQAKIEVHSFKRYELSEGVIRVEANLAEDVQNALDEAAKARK